MKMKKMRIMINKKIYHHLLKKMIFLITKYVQIKQNFKKKIGVDMSQEEYCLFK